ncbi:MAG: histidine phosphatase family protein [Candidatus Eisenbacteria bacterium]|nr:histidine phosphatase family protein [Candidatus Eisenbacteria bacterium]
MAVETRIHFVRHGEAENPQGIFYGRLAGFPLSERGIRQARAAGACLRTTPLEAIYASPLERTRQTAEWIAREHPHLQVTFTDLLIEVATPLEGQPFADLESGKIDAYDKSPAHGGAAASATAFPDPARSSEQPLEILQRMLRFVGGALARHRGRELAAVTHGDCLAFLMLWAAGSPLGREERLALYRERFLSRGSITTFTFTEVGEDKRPRVEYLKPEVPDA